MDDLKVYASTEQQPSLLLSLTEVFSNDIKMSFGADKCKPQSIRKDKHHIHWFQLEDGGISEPVQEGYKNILVFNCAS